MTALIDTNILVHAYNKRIGAKHIRAMALVESIFSGEERFCISSQNIAELFHVLVSRNIVPLDEAKVIVRALIVSPNWVKLNYSSETIEKALNFFKGRPNFWDCLLAATALENNVTIIYTENVKDFKNIPGIKVVNPFK